MNIIPSNPFELNNAVIQASEKTPGKYYSLVAVCSLRHGICCEDGNCNSCKTRIKIQEINI